jgi:hypothetical protein
MSKKKTILIIGYILLLGFLGLYVKSILKRDDLKIYTKKEIKIEKTYKVKVILKTYIKGETSEYVYEFENTDSVEELLIEVRASGDIMYEVTRYTSGVKINSVNGIISNENFEWAVFKNDNNITSKMDKILLEDGQTYELKMTQK